MNMSQESLLPSDADPSQRQAVIDRNGLGQPKSVENCVRSFDVIDPNGKRIEARWVRDQERDSLWRGLIDPDDVYEVTALTEG